MPPCKGSSPTAPLKWKVSSIPELLQGLFGRVCMPFDGSLEAFFLDKPIAIICPEVCHKPLTQIGRSLDTMSRFPCLDLGYRPCVREIGIAAAAFAEQTGTRSLLPWRNACKRQFLRSGHMYQLKLLSLTGEKGIFHHTLSRDIQARHRIPRVLPVVDEILQLLLCEADNQPYGSQIGSQS